jgi:hypothetical protein
MVASRWSSNCTLGSRSTTCLGSVRHGRVSPQLTSHASQRETGAASTSCCVETVGPAAGASWAVYSPLDHVFYSSPALERFVLPQSPASSTLTLQRSDASLSFGSWRTWPYQGRISGAAGSQLPYRGSRSPLSDATSTSARPVRATPRGQYGIPLRPAHTCGGASVLSASVP